MNTLKFYPKKIRLIYEDYIKKSGVSEEPFKYHNKILLITIILSFISSIGFFIFKINPLFTLLVFIILNLFFYFRISLKATNRIKKMEKVFPDVISLMSSNLRAGMTIDKSFFLSAREEFAPLDEEILKTGKQIATGSEVVHAFKEMADRIGSEKISKIILLIISGLKAGGNVSDLLEETSANMREKEFIEKRAASQILMYVIFIFFAIGVGAPFLFALSSVLVDVVISLSATIPEASSSQMNLPLTFNKIGISSTLVIYFAMGFIIVTDLISSLVIGLVNKGEGKLGLKFFIPLVAFSLTIFFAVRFFLTNFLSKTISLG